MISNCHLSRRRRSAIALALALSFLLPAGAAADPYRESALDLTGRLVALFPPGEGYVVSLPAGEVYVDLAEANLMSPGMELFVYREGADIVHPVTGDVLGKHEESLGYLTIKEVREEYSVGLAIDGAKEMRPGDRVRISARPLRALLFFSGESPSLDTGRMALALTEAAVESKRFRLRDEPEWLPRLGELKMSVDEVLADPASLRRLGEHAGADLLFVVTPPGDADPSLGFEVLSLWTGRSLADLGSGWSTAPEAPPPRSGHRNLPSDSSLRRRGRVPLANISHGSSLLRRT